MRLFARVACVALATLLLLPAPALAQEGSANVQKLADPVARYVVFEGSDEQWHAVADWPQGTNIPFMLTGTLPADLESRGTFPYWLVANPGEGLAYVAGSARVTLTHEDGTTQDVTSLLTIGESDDEVFAGSSNILSAISTIKATDTLALRYAARLTPQSSYGFERGNRSLAHIEYEDRNAAAARLAIRAEAEAEVEEAGTRSADLAHSPDLQTLVYTYVLEVQKTNESGSPLAGARVALRDASGLWYVDNDEWSRSQDKAATRTTDYAGAATFERVDSEDYEVVELEAPKGYGVVDPVDVSIESGVVDSGYTLAATSERGKVVGVDAQAGLVRLAIADPVAGEPAAGAAAPLRLRLSRTGDASPAWAPAALLLAVSLVACGVVIRNRGVRNRGSDA